MAFVYRYSTPQDVEQYSLYRLHRTTPRVHPGRTWPIAIDEELGIVACTVVSSTPRTHAESDEYKLYGVAARQCCFWAEYKSEYSPPERRNKRIWSWNDDKTVMTCSYVDLKLIVDPAFDGTLEEAKEVVGLGLQGQLYAEKNRWHRRQPEKYPQEIKVNLSIQFLE